MAVLWNSEAKERARLRKGIMELQLRYAEHAFWERQRREDAENQEANDFEAAWEWG